MMKTPLIEHVIEFWKEEIRRLKGELADTKKYRELQHAREELKRAKEIEKRHRCAIE